MDKTYKLNGDITPDDVAAEVARALQDLQNDSALRDRLSSEGIDIATIGETKLSEIIAVRSPESGFAAETVFIAFLPLAVKVATDIWSKLILPRLERKYGADALMEVKRNA